MTNPDTLNQFIDASEEAPQQEEIVDAKTITMEEMSQQIGRDVLIKKLLTAGFAVTAYEPGKVKVDDGENLRIRDAA